MALPGNMMAVGRLGFEWLERTYSGAKGWPFTLTPRVPQPAASMQQGPGAPETPTLASLAR
jgi:hypothetical protein